MFRVRPINLKLSRYLGLALSAFLLSSCCLVSRAEPGGGSLNPRLVAAHWPASWIASARVPGGEPGVFCFRREITLSSVPAHFWVHISADNRFLLHVNAKYAAEGPARGDLFHWRFETVDLAPLLQPGKNVLAAIVWNFGELAPVAQMSNRTGFLMQGNTEAEAEVNTGGNWRVRQEAGRAALGHEAAGGYYAAGPGEKIDGRLLDWSWNQPGADSSGWEAPQLLGPAATREALDSPIIGNSFRIHFRQWSIDSLKQGFPFA